jgi:hypothetical protein
VNEGNDDDQEGFAAFNDNDDSANSFVVVGGEAAASAAAGDDFGFAAFGDDTDGFAAFGEKDQNSSATSGGQSSTFSSADTAFPEMNDGSVLPPNPTPTDEPNVVAAAATDGFGAFDDGFADFK